MRGRLLLFAWAWIVVPAVVGICARDAHASVSIAVTWDTLLRGSTAAAVATPIDSRAAWENGRIYTYTRLRIDRSVAGALATGDQAWVRTLGGVVDKIGQLVEGEAVFVPGQASLLFLRDAPAGFFVVTARGQGQFPVAEADAQHPARVVRSNSVGALLPPAVSVSSAAQRLAAEVVHNRPLDDVAIDIAAAWERTHATR